MDVIDTKYMWRHTWPSGEVLCEFLASNPKLWKNKVILELGSGVAALPSMTALRCGASKVIITEQNHLKEAFESIEHNLEQNFDAKLIDNCVHLMGLDWFSPDDSLSELLVQASPQLDFVFGSDIFYDPCVFEPLVNFLQKLFKLFPNLEFYFSYQIRDSDWSIEELLCLSGLLEALFIRCVDTERHSICVGKITKRENNANILAQQPTMDFAVEMGHQMIFAGVEGGATHSTLVLLDSTGNLIGEWTDGPSLNCLLNGVEKTADQIAGWIRESVHEMQSKEKVLFKLPIASLGMGLSGAENDGTNQKMLEYLRAQHADVAHTFFLTSDSVAAVASSFEEGGVVLIAGTGSTCRLLKANGDVHGVGGWGHLIGDGGGGFWIAMRAIKQIFDVEDGLFNMEFNISTVKEALLDHFKLNSKHAILDILYNPGFNKSLIASFCKRLSELAVSGDKIANSIFMEAGEILAQHLIAISRHFETKMLEELSVVLIGSVFKSWDLLRKGFENCLRRSVSHHLCIVKIYELDGSTAIGAAILGAKFAINIREIDVLNKLQMKRLIATIKLD